VPNPRHQIDPTPVRRKQAGGCPSSAGRAPLLRLLLATLWLAAWSTVAPAGECRALIVAGDPGPEPHSAARFHDWASRWAKLLTGVYGFKPESIRVLRSPARPANGQVPRPELAKVAPEDTASHTSVVAALAALVRESKEGDQVVLILIGHGYDSQEIGKFCLGGRDLSDVEAGRALDGLRAKRFICINGAPASASWAKALGREGRVVIVATSKPGMRSQTYFTEFLLRALQPGNVTLLDAFNRASLNTVRWYQNQFIEADAVTVHGKEFQEIWKAMYPDRKMAPGSAEPQEPDNDPENQKAWLGRRLIAEIAGLDDNGDGTPSAILDEGTQPSPLPSKSGDGELCRQIILGKP